MGFPWRGERKADRGGGNEVGPVSRLAGHDTVVNHCAGEDCRRQRETTPVMCYRDRGRWPVSTTRSMFLAASTETSSSMAREGARKPARRPGVPRELTRVALVLGVRGTGDPRQSDGDPQAVPPEVRILFRSREVGLRYNHDFSFQTASTWVRNVGEPGRVRCLFRTCGTTSSCTFVRLHPALAGSGYAHVPG